jgi:predicted dehydrogenase
MRYAVVGIGKWGKTVVNVLESVPNAEVVKICSRTPMEPSNELVKYCHTVDYNDIISDDRIDTVFIATHPDSHFSLSKRAILANKHVICEKPCMFSEEQFNEISHLIHKHGVTFYTDYTNLYHNVVSSMSFAINDKDSFKLHLVNVGSGPIRSGYSDFWDYGTHVVSVLVRLFGDHTFTYTSYFREDDGNHRLIFESPRILADVIFGNKGFKRKHTFKLSSPKGIIFWGNDRSENPLLKMLTQFTASPIGSNLHMSKQIYKILKNKEVSCL